MDSKTTQSKRQLQHSELIKRAVTEIMMEKGYFENLSGLQIADVKSSPDLLQTTIFVLPENENQMQYLYSITNKIKAELPSKVELRRIPNIRFVNI